MLAFIGQLGGWEVLIILFLILILFGAKKIPELARGLGKGIREFKDATKDIKNEIEDSVNDDKPAQKSKPASEPASDSQ